MPIVNPHEDYELYNRTLEAEATGIEPIGGFMKTIRAIVIALLAWAVGPFAAGASDLWIEAQYNHITYANDTLDGSRPQYKALAGFKYVYAWVSLDSENSIDYGGQEGVNFSVPGIGLGVRIPLVKYLSAYAEGGYFKPNIDSGWQYAGPALEGMIRYGRQKTAYEASVVDQKWWDKGRMDVSGGFGGELGAALEYPLRYGFTLTGKTGYRYLKLDQHIRMEDLVYDPNRAYWDFDDQLDLSGWIMGVGLKYEF